MVAAVRRGQALRAVARRFHVGVATVAYWVERAEGQRLDRVDWPDRSRTPHKTRRTDTSVEDLVLKARSDLTHSDLGAIGADAIRQALSKQGGAQVPSLRTINRILARRGALDGRPRTRRPPPPKGWYLCDVATAKAELDSFDIVEGLVIKEGPHVEVLNGVSLHGGLVVSWPVESPVTAALTVASLTEHWRAVGLPDYAQFDNDMIFHGTHRYPDALGRVLRLCLSLGVVPVLVPPRETGFQAMIESYNGWWQTPGSGRASRTPAWRTCRGVPVGTCRRCGSSGRHGWRRPRIAAPSLRAGSWI
jgi:putative transposase